MTKALTGKMSQKKLSGSSSNCSQKNKLAKRNGSGV